MGISDVQFFILTALAAASLFLSAWLWKIGDQLQGVDRAATELGGTLSWLMLAVPIFFGLLAILGAVHKRV